MLGVLLLFSMRSRQLLSAFAFLVLSVLPLTAASSRSTDLFSITLSAIAILPLASSSPPAADASITDTFYGHTTQPRLICVFIARAALSRPTVAPLQFRSLPRARGSSLSQSTSLSSWFPL
jgi:hypothetical protein